MSIERRIKQKFKPTDPEVVARGKALQTEIQQLTQIIDEHDISYHQKDAPIVSDAEYDSLTRKLKNLQKDMDLFTWQMRPGASPDDRFAKIYHNPPMLSLDNAFSEEDVAEFIGRIKRFLNLSDEEINDLLITELKIDGLSFSARYEHGEFKQGATRGDGEVGEDITNNLATILPIKLKNNPPSLLVVRGEVYMTKQSFIELNKKCLEEKEPLFANPRNAAAGSMRQLNAEVTKQRKLSYLVYGWGEVSESLGEKHTDFTKAFVRFGFNTIGDFYKLIQD